MTLIDKVKGIFSSTGEDQTVNPNTPEQQQMVDEVLSDFEVFKADRQKMDPMRMLISHDRWSPQIGLAAGSGQHSDQR